MSTFFKLLNFEFNRFFKWLLGIFVFMFVFQVGGTIFSALRHKSYINDILRDGVKQSEVLEQIEPFGLIQMTYNLYFIAPLFIGMAAILFYTFFIWYRDWVGKSTFVYRLFTLPTSRMNVFYAKLVTIFLLSLSLMAYQLMLLFIQSKVIALIIPKVFRAEGNVLNVIHQMEQIYMVGPTSLTEFLYYQFIGLVFTAVFFTCVLLERSYRLIGNVYALIYFVLAVVISLTPIWLMFFIGEQYFYMNEIILFIGVMATIILAISLWFSHYLIHKKVTV